MNNKMYNCRDKSKNTKTKKTTKNQTNWKVLLKQKVWSTKQLWRTKMVKVGYMWDVPKVVFLNEERTTTSHYSILKKYKNCRKLASHVCEMKEKDRSPSVRWRILRKARLYKNGNNMCRLC